MAAVIDKDLSLSGELAYDSEKNNKLLSFIPGRMFLQMVHLLMHEFLVKKIIKFIQLILEIYLK